MINRRGPCMDAPKKHKDVDFGAKIAFLFLASENNNTSLYQALSFYYNFNYTTVVYTASTIYNQLLNLVNQGYCCFVGLSDDSSLSSVIPIFISKKYLKLVTMNSNSSIILPSNIWRFVYNDLFLSLITVVGIYQKTNSYNAMILVDKNNNNLITNANLLSTSLINKGGTTSIVDVNLSSQSAANLDIQNNYPLIKSYTTLYLMTNGSSLPIMLQALFAASAGPFDLENDQIFAYSQDADAQPYPLWTILNIAQSYPVNSILKTFGIDDTTINENQATNALIIDAVRWLRYSAKNPEGLLGYISFEQQNRLPTLGIYFLRNTQYSDWFQLYTFPLIC
jgi:hypothetical protein